MAASYTKGKDKALAEMDVLMKPYETPPESFTIGDIVKRYGLTMNQAHKAVGKLIAAGTLRRLSKNCYVTSLAQPGSSERAAEPESRPTRRTRKR